MSAFLKRILSPRIERTPPLENFFICSGMEFYGDLVASSSSGRIDGNFEGQIIECRRIIIGVDSKIKGNIFAEDILLYGYCEGNLYASGDVKVFDSAVMLGDIHASSRVLVERDSTFRGNLRKLKPEEIADFTVKEKERIISQGRSNVHNIYSLKAMRESAEVRAQKVANSDLAEIPEPVSKPSLKLVEELKQMHESASSLFPMQIDTPPMTKPEPQDTSHTSNETERRWF